MEMYVKITEGALHPLSECKWVRFNPEGCAYSSSYGDAATTPEDAHKSFVPRKRDRDREIHTGWTVQLLSKQQWDEKAAPCFYGNCTHRDSKPGGEAA